MTTIDNSDDTSASEDELASYPKPAYAWYVVVLMMCFYVLSFMDRQIIAVMLEPIKADLDLTDVQISLIGGISFTIFYSVAG
ncbi:MAG: MFS transporter, partial [Woeseiales bacterium]